MANVAHLGAPGTRQGTDSGRQGESLQLPYVLGRAYFTAPLVTPPMICFCATM